MEETIIIAVAMIIVAVVTGEEISYGAIKRMIRKAKERKTKKDD